MIIIFSHTEQPRWFIEVEYTHGLLKTIHINTLLKTVEDERLQNLIKMVKIRLSDTHEAMNAKGFVGRQKLKGQQTEEHRPLPRPVNPNAFKFVVWRKSWHKHTGDQYSMSKGDAGKLVRLEVSEHEMNDLCDFYHTCNEWYAKSKGLGAFITHINSIRADMKAHAAKAKNPHGFPLDASKEAEQAIKDPTQLKELWKFWRSLGWRKNERGVWYKPTPEQVQQTAVNEFYGGHLTKD